MAPHNWALQHLEDVLIYQKKPNLTWHGIQKGEIQGYRKTSFQSLVHRHLSDRRVSLRREHGDLSSLGLFAVCLPPCLSWLWGPCPCSLYQANLVELCTLCSSFWRAEVSYSVLQSGTSTREANLPLANVEPLSQPNFSALVCYLKAQAQGILKAKFT